MDRFRGGCRRSGESGAALAAVMTMVAIMGILMTVAAQQWSFIQRREMERELIYRGQNIMSAIEEYQRQAQNQRPPTKLEDLTKGPRPTLRRVWVDPMTARYDRNGDLVEGTGDFELLTPTQPPGPGGQAPPASTINLQGIIGVASKSDELSIGSWGDIPPGSAYTEWRFEVLNIRTNTPVNPLQGGDRVELRPPGFGGDARAPGSPAPPSSPLGTGLPGTRRAP